MIQASQLTLTYKDGTVALHPCDLTIGPGELVIITGPSGSGKTSLLKLLIGSEFPTGGSVSTLGASIEKKNNRAIMKMRHLIGPVFQEFRLIKGKTALQNVMLGMRFLGIKPSVMLEESKQALIRVGLEDKFNSKVENLSWGENQRVAIARAVARKPSLILADEPTGNLDETNALKILELLASFRTATTSVVMTTHATHLIDDHDLATRVYMDRGNIRVERPVN